MATRIAVDDGEGWDDSHLYRWGPARHAPPEPEPDEAFDDEEDEFGELDNWDDPEPAETRPPPDVPSTLSTSASAGEDAGKSETGKGEQQR